MSSIIFVKAIPLTHEECALVSTEDCNFLMQWKWHVRHAGNTLYACRSINFKKSNGKWTTRVILMHRVVLARKLGHENFPTADHYDGNGLHNYRSNLRPATRKQNCENRKGLDKNNRSGVRGVSWHKAGNKWVAQITHCGEIIYLGLYEDIKEAEQVVIAARAKLFTHHRGQ